MRENTSAPRITKAPFHNVVRQLPTGYYQSSLALALSRSLSLPLSLALALSLSLSLSHREASFGGDTVLHQLKLCFVNEITPVSVNELEGNLKL